jgi:ATP-dependent helicase/nuclease subunit A
VSGGNGITWSDAARALFSLTGPTAVSAGAGSGKTTCLVELCVRLLAGEATGAPLEAGEIVAITFTDKAAEELADRLRGAVAARARAAAGADDAAAWRERLRGLERMAVGTIHAFAARLLREHALEAGLDPEFEVADEETASEWRRAAARAAVIAALDAQDAGARLLCAAHGMGARRGGVPDLVADLARERATLGDRRTPVAAPDRAAEVRAAWAEVLAAAGGVLAVRCATATGKVALERVAAARGEARAAEALSPDALRAADALAAALKGWRIGAQDDDARGARDRLAAACAVFVPAAAEALAGPAKRALAALVDAAEARYRDAKRAARALDFDDLLTGARDLLARDAALRAELRGRWRALLVDEYQDVNAVQQELFDLLAGGGGPRPILVAVGDLKQSIYRFRGADVSVFRGVLERFGAAPPARVLHLSDNHRSSPAVLALVNEVFARCMQPGPGARPYELAFADDDRLRPVRHGGSPIAAELLVDEAGGGAAARRAREARAIAARIDALVSGRAGVAVRDRGVPDDAPGRRPRHEDLAILFRRLTEVREYEEALRAAGIPYRLARGGGFYQAPEVRDLAELAASLADPGDALAWASVLRSPLCAVSDAALVALAQEGFATLGRREPAEVARALVEAHPAAGRPWPALSSEADRLRRFLAVWRELQGLAGKVALGELMAAAVERLDLFAAHLASPDGERRAANVRKALAVARRLGARGATVAGFARALRAAAERPPREAEAELEGGGAVALLSVHQAKGLEWPIVFVPDLGAPPPRDARRALRTPDGEIAVAFHDAAADVHHATAATEEAKEEARRAAAAESRRLLYVALTRARDRLVLSGEAGRGGGDTWRALVEAGIAGCPELVVRVPVEEAGTYRERDHEHEHDPDRDPDHDPAANADLAPPRLAPPPRLAAVRIAVTDLAEHARCPRRAFLARHLGIAEPARGASAVRDDPDRATARGTLAHAMIAEVDLTAPPLERRVQLEAVARRRGFDPRARGVRQILGDVARFLDGPAGRALSAAARSGALRREVPFQLRLAGDGATCYVVGSIDALVEGRRDVAVVDFKYAVARPEARERYRLQLLAYALAAGGACSGRKVTARLQFLRGACGAVDLTPSAAELRRFAREAPIVAASAHAWAGSAPEPAELGRSEERCRSEGCGYVGRCFARPRGAAADPALAR